MNRQGQVQSLQDQAIASCSAFEPSGQATQGEAKLRSSATIPAKLEHHFRRHVPQDCPREQEEANISMGIIRVSYDVMNQTGDAGGDLTTKTRGNGLDHVDLGVAHDSEKKLKVPSQFWNSCVLEPGFWN